MTSGVLTTAPRRDSPRRPRVRTIALAGNPNSGKTTVFNALTGMRQKVGNYPGVTVEKKIGWMTGPEGGTMQVVDLPGIYSLTARSPDERIARDVLRGRSRGTPRPDLVVCVLDGGNLERHLYLVTQIQDLGLPVIVVLNMMDEVRRRGRKIDVEGLAGLIGAPVVPMAAVRGEGVAELRAALAGEVPPRPVRPWRMSPRMEDRVSKIVDGLRSATGRSEEELFFDAVGLCSGAMSPSEVTDDALVGRWLTETLGGSEELGLSERTAPIEARYEWIRWVVRRVVTDPEEDRLKDRTRRIDAVLLHRIWGPLFFLGCMGFMFELIYFVAAYPMAWIDAGFSALGGWAGAILPSGPLRGLLVDGILAGVGGVVVFLPQILILYFFLGLLQDSGYMARAAFLMDRVMRRVGLHGKSFIPLLSSFACAVPGIMSARTIEQPKERLVTMLVAPLMSCSARLPVYTILIAVLMPQSPAWVKAGLMLGLYLTGIVGAFAAAWCFRRVLLRGRRPVFLMELPPYRLPSLKAVLLQMRDRAGIFLRRVGTVILALSILLWALMSYPRTQGATSPEALRQSYAGRIGRVLEPALRPLGYDWRIGIGLVGSFAAREVFVSTMGIVFNLEDDADRDGLRAAFHRARRPDGRRLFTPLVCLSLLVFYVFAMQCLSTVAVMVRETGGWRWPLVQIAYMTLLAYAAAFLVYQGGRFLGFA